MIAFGTGLISFWFLFALSNHTKDMKLESNLIIHSDSSWRTQELQSGAKVTWHLSFKNIKSHIGPFCRICDTAYEIVTKILRLCVNVAGDLLKI